MIKKDPGHQKQGEKETDETVTKRWREARGCRQKIVLGLITIAHEQLP